MALWMSLLCLNKIYLYILNASIAIGLTTYPISACHHIRRDVLYSPILWIHPFAGTKKWGEVFEEDILIVFYYLVHLKSGLIRRMAFGESGLIRGGLHDTAFIWCQWWSKLCALFTYYVLFCPSLNKYSLLSWYNWNVVLIAANLKQNSK